MEQKDKCHALQTAKTKLLAGLAKANIGRVEIQCDRGQDVTHLEAYGPDGCTVIQDLEPSLTEELDTFVPEVFEAHSGNLWCGHDDYYTITIDVAAATVTLDLNCRHVTTIGTVEV